MRYTTTGSIVLNWAHPRWINIQTAPGGGIPALILPRADLRPEYARFEGKSVFHICRTTARARIIVNGTGTQLHIMSVDKMVYCYLLDAANDEWLFIERSLAYSPEEGGEGEDSPPTVTNLTGTTSPGHSYTVPTVPTTYTSSCFLGDDCEYLLNLGQTPLGGGEGFEVVAPMFQDPCTHAQNQEREAVRAADIIMPNLIAVRFARDEFTEDSSHPWYGTYGDLSTEFYDTLYRASTGYGAPWVLTYDNALKQTSGTLRHWHHINRRGSLGASWGHGTGSANLTGFRYVWKATETYGPTNDPEAYTMTVYFIMEHTLTAEAVADSSGGGYDYIGAGVPRYGMWGAHCILAVFTDELNPAWVDDSTTFQAADMTTAFTYNKRDPGVSGLAYGLSETGTTDQKASRRGVHPQCAILAHIPTTWEAPCGRNWVPPKINERSAPNFRSLGTGLGRNLARLYDVPNGSPWLDISGCGTTYPGETSAGGSWPAINYGMLYNCVFGYYGSSTVAKAMTLGGSVGEEGSAFLEWMAIENGNGDGRTYLIPSKAGWDEQCGELTVAAGSSISISLCTSDGDCLPDDELCSDRGEWPRTLISPCDGHPDEPLMGVGGTHHSFRNRDQAQGRDGHLNTTCCVPMAPTSLTGVQFCSRTETEYGPPQFSQCETQDVDCSRLRSYTTSYTMYYWDHTHMPGAAGTNQALRTMEWGTILPNTLTRPLRDLDPYANTDWTAYFGTIAHNASDITISNVAGTSAVRALSTWTIASGTGWDWFGVEISATFDDCFSEGHGLAFMEGSAGSNTLGYGLYVYSTNGKDLIIELNAYSSGSKETITTTTIIDAVSGEGDAVFRVHGMDLTGTFTPSGGDPVSITGECTGVGWVFVESVAASGASGASATLGMRPGVFTEETAISGTIQFTNVTIEDLVPDYVSSYGSLGDDSVAANMETTTMRGYGKCAEVHNPDCGTCCSPAICNCTISAEQLHTVASGTLSNSGNDVFPQSTFLGCEAVDNPCDPESPWQESNPTSAALASPFRCYCASKACAEGIDPCSDCGPNPSTPMLYFPLPIDQDCWNSSIDVNCLGSIPLMCHGMAAYAAIVVLCE